jgi:hypothetical protein
MKRLLTAAMAVSAIIGAGSVSAGKVNLPKEGNYEFEFCVIGHGKTFSSGDKVFVISYEGDANLRTTPSGRPFDKMGARCEGIYTKLNGQQNETGVCELTDVDGDKWWMDYHGLPDGTGGTYTSASGTGKYEGMTLRGEYHIDNNWGSSAKDVAFQGCNPNKGSYKLK